MLNARRLILNLYIADPEPQTGEIDVELTENCKECNGVGKVVDYEAETFSKCPEERCVGGEIPTVNGGEILAFMARYWCVLKTERRILRDE